MHEKGSRFSAPHPLLPFCRLTVQKVRDVLQLRNLVGTETAVLLEEGKDVVELLTGVGWVEVDQLVVDCPPGADLLVCILDARDLFTAAKRSVVRETEILTVCD